MWNDMGVALHEVLSRNLPAATEKYHENPHSEYSMSRPIFDLGPFGLQTKRVAALTNLIGS
jgi:hypothetical protein